ncbi:v-type ATP synthase alpha chain [Striga asiatica]|uniref:V-type ATP synthase alpha chain n=1 Tax=Striga asiatica TaxID=4170 RepID=A0A5A7Q9Y6_STRAF|nr:v-type ATP synthase alpha chain [Striga asiatica]
MQKSPNAFIIITWDFQNPQSKHILMLNQGSHYSPSHLLIDTDFGSNIDRQRRYHYQAKCEESSLKVVIEVSVANIPDEEHLIACRISASSISGLDRLRIAVGRWIGTVGKALENANPPCLSRGFGANTPSLSRGFDANMPSLS